MSCLVAHPVCMCRWRTLCGIQKCPFKANLLYIAANPMYLHEQHVILNSLGVYQDKTDTFSSLGFIHTCIYQAWTIVWTIR